MRILLIGLTVLCLAAAVTGGLVRAGSSIPVIPAAILYHGPLMVSVFFGTLIGIERAVALGGLWPWYSPVLSLLSGALLLSGSDLYHPLALAAAALFVGGGVAGYRRAPQVPLLVMAIGSAFWVMGNIICFLVNVPAALPSWIAFLAITIAGERLEFSKLRQTSRGEHILFLVPALLLAAAAIINPLSPSTGNACLGVGLFGLGTWLLSFDIARQTVKRAGSARFIALTLLLGYAWLAVGGILAIVLQEPYGGFGYDAWIHAFFVGFVFSMVFGHGPVIFPALVRRSFSFSRVLYVPVAVLNASLAVRIFGDLTLAPTVRLLGGWGNALAIAVFFAAILYCLVSAQLAGRQKRAYQNQLVDPV